MIFADCDEVCVIKAFEVDSLNCVNWIFPINFYTMNFAILKLLCIVLLANKLKCKAVSSSFSFFLSKLTCKVGARMFESKFVCKVGANMSFSSSFNFFLEFALCFGRLFYSSSSSESES